MAAKRKRDTATEPDEPSRREKRKARKNNHGSTKGTATKSKEDAAATKPSPMTEEVPLHESVAQAIRALQPPSGLKKRQRKRWRRLVESAAAGLISGQAQPSHQSGQTDPAPAEPDASTEIKRPSDQALLKQLSTTQLPPKPIKRWYDEKSQHKPVAPEILASESPAGSRSVMDKTRGTINSDAISKESIQSYKKPDIPPSAAFTSVPSKASTKIHHPSRSTPVDFHPGERHPSQYYSPRDIPLSMNYHSSSFSNKCTYIPTVFPDPDVLASFKQFSAFVRGRNIDSDSSDDDESEESDSDEESTLVVKHNKQIVGSLPAASEGVTFERHDRDQQSPSSQTLRHEDSGVANTHVLKSDELEEDDLRIPSFAKITSEPAFSTRSSRLANIGIKRQTRNSGKDFGARPDSDATLDNVSPDNKRASQNSQHLAFLDDSDDDSEAVYEAVDEIARNVFTSTTPLPASKPLVSVDPEREDPEPRLMTSASSDTRRVTRSMSTPKTTPRRGVHPEIPVVQHTPVIVRSLRLDGVQQLPTRSSQPAFSGTVEEASGSDSDNIDVTILPYPSKDASSGSLSELSRSPSPPAVGKETSTIEARKDPSDEEADTRPEKDDQIATPPSKKKRKMTGRTSKHFAPEPRKRSSKRLKIKAEERIDNEASPSAAVGQREDEEPNTPIKPETPSRTTRSSTKPKRKGTGKKSSYFTPTKPPLDPEIIDRVDFYNTTGKKKRVPAGVSVAPVPPIASSRFGIIQEKLWREPFWLLIAVTFLNKTTGRAAVPVFWDLKKRYPTAEALADAELTDLHEMIWHLGLQRQRSKRLIAIAKAWIEDPPAKGRRWRTLHYPLQGDGKEHKKGVLIEEDVDECEGALEIGHLPGCGPYAWDSWRIFCRDVLRGVAEDYDGKGAEDADFIPEWRKVLPLDKELRACLRWMWLREGWIWDCVSGERREATEEEMEMAVRGEMEISDEQERKFAAQAAGVEMIVRGADSEALEDEDVPSPTPRGVESVRSEPEVDDDESASDNIVVSTPAKKNVRRSIRLNT